MDQEIEAEATEFLAFLERCSQQSRPSTTSYLSEWLKKLHVFLKRIQPILDPTFSSDENVGTATLTASKLYPTLGKLLNQLCVNPVVLSSEPVADLVVQSVFNYSNNAINSLDYAQTSWKETSVQRWRAYRLREMLKNPWHAPQRNKNTRYMEMRKADRAFTNLFEISEADMEQQKVAETIRVLSHYLSNLTNMVATNHLAATSRTLMITWNRQLSGLCTPLVSYPDATLLIGGVIDLAYTLKAEDSSNLLTRHPTVFLDFVFVEKLILHSGDKELKSYILSDDSRILRICTVSSLARQHYLVQLIDKVMKASANQPGFFVDQEDIFRDFIETSQLAAVLARTFKTEDREYNDLVRCILEDIAAMAGDIADWRFVRICVVLTRWILTLRKNEEIDKDIDLSGFNTNMDLQGINNVTETSFEAMVSSSFSLLQRDPRDLSIRASFFSDLSRLIAAQQEYVYCFAGPDRLMIRRGLVFLTSTAIAQYDGFLIHQIRTLLDSLEMAHSQQGQDDESLVENQLVQFMVGLVLADDSKHLSFSNICERLNDLLQELHHVCKASDGQNSTPMSIVEPIEDVLIKYRLIFQMNKTLIADMICAVGQHIDAKEPSFWHSMIQVAISVTHEFKSVITYVNASSLPLVTRFHDISRSIHVYGLSNALTSMNIAKN
ncbi:hypothetical protein BGZ46_007904 [Entomortierella lignicola]|nr:hypothetical protein BGZ46_007904 [Entomortierella lignicola]